MLPDFTLERQLTKKGYSTIFGVDEVGVGPLAGQVTATAVTCPAKSSIFPPSLKLRRVDNFQFSNLRDSKKLSSKQRDGFFQDFKDESSMYWAVASITPKVIDRINIFQARQLASVRAILKLEKTIGHKADFIILDGKNVLKIARKQEAIIKGDEKVALCAIASIIAKVTRDRAMMRVHSKYPNYRFDLHKGYGTKLHYEMLAKHGPCPAHRKSFNLKIRS